MIFFSIIKSEINTTQLVGVYKASKEGQKKPKIGQVDLGMNFSTSSTCESSKLEGQESLKETCEKRNPEFLR